MKESEKNWRAIEFLLGIPLALFYSMFWGRNYGAKINFYINLFIIIGQNIALYVLCLKEKRKGQGANNKFQWWSIRINQNRWTTSWLSGNVFFFIVGSIWFRLGTFFLGLEEKPKKFLWGLILAIIGKSYTEMIIGRFFGWVINFFRGLW